MARGVRGAATEDRRELRERLVGALRLVPDFPRPGIIFRDVTPLLREPSLFTEAIDAITAAHAQDHVDLVAGIEARGFLLAAPVAYQLGAGLLPVRKQGRLPGPTASAAYALEYGEAVLEVHVDAISPGQRVLIVDDLLATGGTAAATISLVERLGGVVTGLAFLIELVNLDGASALGAHRHTSLITD